MRTRTLTVQDRRLPRLPLVGDSLWGALTGVMTVGAILVHCREAEDEAGLWGPRTCRVVVAHDRSWEVYTDSGPGPALSAYLSGAIGEPVTVDFSAQGGQAPCVAEFDVLQGEAALAAWVQA